VCKRAESSYKYFSRQVEERNGEFGGGWGKRRCRAEIRTVDRQKLNNRAEPPRPSFPSQCKWHNNKTSIRNVPIPTERLLRFPFPLSFSPAPSLLRPQISPTAPQAAAGTTYVPPIGGPKDINPKSKKSGSRFPRDNAGKVGNSASAGSIGNLLDGRKTKNLRKVCRWIRFKRWRSTITASCLPSLFRAGTSSG